MTHTTEKDYECEDCIGMKDRGCYCQAVGAVAPGGPLSTRHDSEQRYWRDELENILANRWPAVFCEEGRPGTPNYFAKHVVAFFGSHPRATRFQPAVPADELLERLDDQGLYSKTERIQMIKDAAAEIRRLSAALAQEAKR